MWSNLKTFFNLTAWFTLAVIWMWFVIVKIPVWLTSGLFFPAIAFLALSAIVGITAILAATKGSPKKEN